MSQSLEIPDDIYSRLQAAAAASGTTPVGWIVAKLPSAVEAELPADDTKIQAKTLADLFEGDVGVIEGNGSDRLSENCGEKFTDYLEAKRKAGHL